jgi:signal transduction histidine kinase
MGIVREKQHLIAELSHQINSPLAAMRNALYLASCRSQDPALLRYLELANEEISSIASILRETRFILEDMAHEEACGDLARRPCPEPVRRSAAA